MFKCPAWSYTKKPLDLRRLMWLNYSKKRCTFRCINMDMKTILNWTFQNTNLVHILLIFNNISYITLLNMFRAARCSSSGGPIVSPQPLVSSPSVSSRAVCGWRALSTRILYGCLQRVTIPEAVVIQLVLLMMSSVLLETC